MIEDRQSKVPTSQRPLITLALTVAAIFFAELMVMLGFYLFPYFTQSAEIILDPVLMAMILLPFLYVSVYRPLAMNIRRLQRSRQAILRISHYDRLTGLPNRLLFEERLQHEITHACHNDQAFALVVLTIRHLPDINFTLGYLKGDQVMKEIAGRIANTFGHLDVSARFGGGEFAVLMKAPDREAVLQVVRQLQHTIVTPVIIDDVSVCVDSYAGLVFYPDHGDEPNLLIRRAHMATRQAKQKMANYSIYDMKYDNFNISRLKLLSSLHEAIARNELCLHYQPKLNARSGTITGAEALLRWNHPSLGAVSPSDFIPLAEKTGLIKEITRWVLAQVFRQCDRWRQQGGEISIAINLSARDIQDPQLVNYIDGLMQQWPLPAGVIEFEVTESDVMSNPELSMEILNKLHARGFTLAVDDFGTGYSSLAYLSRLPLHILKIDRYFISNMLDSRVDAMIVKSTIDLAHNMNLSVVAEGVENEAMLDYLVELNCEYFQGFYISRPLPPADFWEFLQLSADNQDTGQDPTERNGGVVGASFA